MEHLVQFGITVDDQRIEEAVIKAAANEVTAAFKDGSYYNRKNIDARRIIEDCVENKLNELRDEIIEAASEKLCEYMKRTKAVKEAIANVVGD